MTDARGAIGPRRISVTAAMIGARATISTTSLGGRGAEVGGNERVGAPAQPTASTTSIRTARTR